MNSRNSGTSRRLLCHCGLETYFLTSRQTRSYGRQFYRCPRILAEKCDFFQWAEEQIDSGAKSDSELIASLEDKID